MFIESPQHRVSWSNDFVRFVALVAMGRKNAPNDEKKGDNEKRRKRNFLEKLSSGIFLLPQAILYV